jgi:hypothetical protein
MGLPLACAVCWKSSIFKNFVCFMERSPQSFPQLPWKMLRKSFVASSGGDALNNHENC